MRRKTRSQLTKALKNMSDESINWYFEIECNDKVEYISLYANNKKEAIEKLNNKMGSPFTIISVSAI